MKVIDLTEEHKELYFVCLEDWSDEMKEAGNHKECWNGGLLMHYILIIKK